MLRYALAVAASAILFAAGWTVTTTPAFAAGCGSDQVAGEGGCIDVPSSDDTTSDENGTPQENETPTGDDVTEADRPD
jgi:hypothetical protein